MKAMRGILAACLLGGVLMWAPASAGAATLAAGAFHSLWIAHDGLMWGSGYNATGALGDGTFTNRSVPVPVGHFNDWTAVSAGYYSSFGIRRDGGLWAWGDNTYGQLGTGTTTKRAVPTRIASPSTFISVAGGARHTLAVRSDGTLWAWGDNGYGQLGTGGSTRSLKPVRVGTANDWASVSCGIYHSAAVKRDGSIWLWGYNADGQVGDHTENNRHIPFMAASGAVCDAVWAGGYHSLARWAPGTAKPGQLTSWGTNRFGQLGNGMWAIIVNTTPAPVASTVAFYNVAPGAFHTVALRPDMYVYAWGRNNHGQVGDGTADEVRTTPTLLTGINGVTSIAAGEEFSLAGRIDGTVWGWGSDGNGQLGLPGMTGSRVPVRIASLRTAYLSTPRAGTVVLGRSLSASGRMLPIHSGPVKVHLYRKSGSSWVPVKTVSGRLARTSTGMNWTATFKPTSRGDWAIRASHTDGAHQLTYSPLRIFRVR